MVPDDRRRIHLIRPLEPLDADDEMFGTALDVVARGEKREDLLWMLVTEKVWD